MACVPHIHVPKSARSCRRNGVGLHALVGRHHAGGACRPAGRADARGRCLRWRPKAFLPSAAGRDGGRMRSPCWRSRALPALPFPPRWRPDACCWDGVRGRFPCWPVQALDALPVMALGCPIRTGWRSGCVNHRAESGADFHTNRPLVPAQRVAHQPRPCENNIARSGKRFSKNARS